MPLLENKVYYGDCLYYMNGIKDKSVDLILCDLPYGITQHKSDIIIPFEALWKHYKRIIKDNGAILLFGSGLFYIDLVNSNRSMFRYDLIWNKKLSTGFLNAKKMPLRQHEMIAGFYKKSPDYNPQFTEGNPLHSLGKKHKGRICENNNNYGRFSVGNDERAGSTEKYPVSILSFQKPHPSVAKHRTEKPVKLLEWLIKTYSNEEDLILDNCCGSGSTLEAAKNLKRNFIGIEKDISNKEIIEERIKE